MEVIKAILDPIDHQTNSHLAFHYPLGTQMPVDQTKVIAEKALISNI